MFVSGFMSNAFANLNFDDFSTMDGLRLNGDAAHFGNRLRLTPARGSQSGSAWFIVPQFIEDGFETGFQFQITELINDGADGLAFVIQNSSISALGALGGCMGYSGDGDYCSDCDGWWCSPPPGIANSIAIEFDTWLNPDPFNDPNDNHVSVHTRGMLPNSPEERFSLGVTTNIPNMKDGNVHTVIIGYIPGEMAIYVDDFTSPCLVVPLDLASVLSLSNGEAFVGFTSGTGWAAENHDILSWYYTAL
jgi:hypothetical protein